MIISSTTDIKWQLVNMRNISCLLGVESIHDLYSRYNPSLNSVRFRNTKTSWKDGIVMSYAPAHEWKKMGEIVSTRFYELDPYLLQELDILYNRKREKFFNFIEYLSIINLKHISDWELGNLLLQFESITLGELYVLNFIQIEHGLTLAMQRVLSELVSECDIDGTFEKLIGTEILTESGKEERELLFLVYKWRIITRLCLGNEEKIRRDLFNHYKKHQHLYCGYGEVPKDVAYFEKRFSEYMNKPPRSFIAHAISWIKPKRLLTNESRALLAKYRNEKLRILTTLLVRGGIFRDINKSLLGRSMNYRYELLDEISRRGFDTRNKLNYYLLSELIELVSDNSKLSIDEINRRKSEGIVLERKEGFSESREFFHQSSLSERKELRGRCASRGRVTGICRIVHVKHDIEKVGEGDIMVATGTDFDVIEAMYRASGIITEEGGLLSHASVVCRELHKPCCIAVKDATHILHDGEKVTLDATDGIITF